MREGGPLVFLIKRKGGRMEASMAKIAIFHLYVGKPVLDGSEEKTFTTRYRTAEWEGGYVTGESLISGSVHELGGGPFIRFSPLSCGTCLSSLRISESRRQRKAILYGGDSSSLENELWGGRGTANASGEKKIKQQRTAPNLSVSVRISHKAFYF